MAISKSEYDPTVSMSDAETVRWLWEDGRRHRKPLDESITKDLEFGLEFNHWKLDAKDEEDPRRIRPKDETLYRRGRYIAESMLGRPLFFQGLPTDPNHTPEQVEIAANVAEWEFTNPLKRFQTVHSKAVWGAVFARMWILGLDYVDFGGRVEIVHRAVDPRRVVWTPGYDDPHDPMCPWLIEEDYLPIDQIAAMKGWKNNKDLAPDSGRVYAEETGSRPFRSDFVSAFSAQTYMGRSDIPRATVLKIYWKRDYTKKLKPMDDSPALPEGEQYMACPKCGYQSAPQVENPDPMPPHVLSGCPQCAGDIWRVDTLGKPQSTFAYPGAQSFMIVAPFQPEGPVELVSKSPWPLSREGYTQRSFPYTPLYFGENPIKPCGQSETSLMRSRQIILDVLLRHGYEQLANAKLLTILPRVGLEDWAGQPFMFTDEQGHFAFKTTEYTDKVEFIQAQGIANGLASFYSIVEGSARSGEGTSELGMAPGQSKDIPVGTIEQLVKTGNVPIDGKARMHDNQLSIHAMVCLDMWRKVNVEPVPVRTKGADGSATVQMLSSFDVVPADIVLSATPSFDGFTVDRMNAFEKIIQMPPQYRPAFVHAFNMPPSVLRAISAAEANAPKAPNVPPDKLIDAISTLIKAGFPVAANQVESALETAGLPPPDDGGSEVFHGAPGNGGAEGAPMPGQPGGGTNGAPNFSGSPGPPQNPAAMMSGRQ